MQQLLEQMREERSNLPLPIEWDRAYQAIEMMITNTYTRIEQQQIELAWEEGAESEYQYHVNSENRKDSQSYYNETYNGDQSVDTNEMVTDTPTCPKCSAYDWSYWVSIDKMKCGDCGYIS